MILKFGLLAFRLRSSVICSLLLIIPLVLQGDIIYPDFTSSTLRDGRDLYLFNRTFTRRQARREFTNTAWLDLFRNAYGRNIILAQPSEPTDEFRIPPIIHQIWLGSPPPEKYREWMTNWMNWHGWTYKLWTDEDVKCRQLRNQELYDNTADFGEKSDILRIELLFEYGGMYVDVDCECINPAVFDELHRTWDLYIGFEPLDHGLLEGYGMFKLCNALMGAAPGHPVVEKLMLELPDNYETHKHLWAVERTGPAFVSRTIFAYEKENPRHGYRNMYLPASFLYPFSEPEMRRLLDNNNIDLYAAPETAAIHYWSHSWTKPNNVCGNLYFDRKIRKLIRRLSIDLDNIDQELQ